MSTATYAPPPQATLDFDELKRRAGMRPVESRTHKRLAYGQLTHCPFHKDSTPSFGPYPDKRKRSPRWKCLGCGWEGDAIDFVAEHDHITQADARRKLKAEFDNSPVEDLPAAPDTPVQHAWHWTKEKVQRAAALLETDRAALEFLASRGISTETIRKKQIGLLAACKDYPARVVLPTFVDGEVVAVKLRAFGEFDAKDKWRKLRRDENVYHLFNRDAALTAQDLYVVESELDCLMLESTGLAAISVDSAGHRLTMQDEELLKVPRRVILALDTDKSGQDCSKRFESLIPQDKLVKITPQGVKDLGEMRAKAPDTFVVRLKKLVRFAQITRKDITWDDLLTEDEVIEQQGLELEYVVDKLIPEQRITMFYGKEKSGKSLLAYYIGKCAANNVPVFDNYKVKQMPVIYIDAEAGVLGKYMGWMRPIGSVLVRLITLQGGIRALDDPALLKICREYRPLIIIDSLSKFMGRGADRANAWRSSDMEPVLEKIRQLCVAGATVILIHHAQRSDPEEYRDSGAIGAGVDFSLRCQFGNLANAAATFLLAVSGFGIPSSVSLQRTK